MLRFRCGHALTFRSLQVLFKPSQSRSAINVRKASLNSAIGRGIRRSRATPAREDRKGRGREFQREGERSTIDSRQTTRRSSYEESNSPRRTLTRDRSADYGLRRPERAARTRRGSRRALSQGDASMEDEDGRSEMMSFKEPSYPRPRRDRGGRDRFDRDKSQHFSDRDDIRRRPESSGVHAEDYKPVSRWESSQRQSHSRQGENRFTRDGSEEERPTRHVKVPLSVPYTTPASEFIYGTSSIMAALRSRRRKLYKLYIYEGANREVVARDESVRKFALTAGVHVSSVTGDWLRLMDKMSAGRPHNVSLYVALRNPLPVPLTE